MTILVDNRKKLAVSNSKTCEGPPQIIIKIGVRKKSFVLVHADVAISGAPSTISDVRIAVACLTGGNVSFWHPAVLVSDGTLITQRLWFSPAPHPHRHVLGWYRLVKEMKECGVNAICVFDGKERNLAKKSEVGGLV